MFLNVFIILAEMFNYYTFPLQDLFESVSLYRWELWQRVQEMTPPWTTTTHPAEHSKLTVGLLSHNRTLYYWQFFLFLEQSPFISLFKTAAKIIFLSAVLIKLFLQMSNSAWLLVIAAITLKWYSKTLSEVHNSSFAYIFLFISHLCLFINIKTDFLSLFSFGLLFQLQHNY